jgi:hypothetical protein
MGWFKRWYGANPLHLLALIGCLALTWYAGARLLHAKPVDVFIWFAGAVVGHDLILLPLYALADKSVTTVFRHRPPKLPTVPWINYLRVPVVLSGLLLLLWFPLIFKIPSRFPSYTDLSLDPYLGHWLAVTGALFLLSAVALAARLRPGRQPVVPYRPDADADADFDPGPAVHHPAAYDGTAYDGTTYDGTAAYDDPFGPPQRPSYGTDDPFGPPQRLYDTQDQRSWEGPPPAAPSRGPGPGRHRQAAGDSQWQQGARQRQRPGNAPQRPGEGRPRPDEDPRQWRGDPRQRPGEGRPPWPDDARQRQGGARPRPQEDPRQWRDDPRQRPGEGRPPWPEDDHQWQEDAWQEDARPWPEEDPRQWRTDPRQRPGDR